MPSSNLRPLPPLSAKDIQRFWGYVDVCGDDECWPWTGNRSHEYGRFGYSGDEFVATRIACKLQRGFDPFPLFVLHTCDYKPCCNAAHFFLGDERANGQDASAKGFFVGRKWMRGAGNGHAKLTNDDVLKIRSLYPEHSQPELARMFNVNKPCIWKIVNRRTWGDLLEAQADAG